MEREEEILKRYEKADFFERMCLFLEYRDLRDAFQKMGFKESTTKGESSLLAEFQKNGIRRYS